MDSIASRARQAAIDHDWEEARRLYDKAIRISVASPDISLYDKRADVLEHLGCLREALGDAKQMLQLRPKDARGYLRAGKVYQLMKKDASALSTYEKGIKVVTSTDPLYKTLIKVQTVIEGRLLKASPRIDPFDLLPLELSYAVISYLSFRQQLVCLSVSKLWHRILTCNGGLYRNLDGLLDGKHMPSPSSMETYIKRSKGKLERLTLGSDHKLAFLKSQFQICLNLISLSVPIQSGLLETLQYAKNLRRINLTNRPRTDVMPDLDSALEFAKRFKYLTHFACPVLPTNDDDDWFNPEVFGPVVNEDLTDLRVLNLQYWLVETFYPNFLPYTSPPFLPNLVELGMVPAPENVAHALTSDFVWPGRLTKLRLGPCVLFGAIRFPATLEELDVQAETWHPRRIPVQLPTLRRLVIRNYRKGLTAEVWAQFLQPLKHLLLLDFLMGEDELSIITGACHGLQELTLTTQRMVNCCDDLLIQLVDRNPELETLGLTNFVAIGGSTLAQCTKKLPRLRRLVIDGCQQIRPEIVQWVRSRGVSVSQKLPKL